MGGQPAVEHQFGRQGAGPAPPVLDEAEELVVPVRLADLGVGMDEEAGVGVRKLFFGRPDQSLPSSPKSNVQSTGPRFLAIRVRFSIVKASSKPKPSSLSTTP